MRGWLIRFVVALNVGTSFAQVVQADFTIPTQACREQNIILSNTSTNADHYEWDFCEGDLSNTPIGTDLVALGGSVVTGIEIIFDGTNWFGFATSQATNSILRMDFGTNIYSTPTVTNLGNIGNALNAPTDIKVVFENGNWYGFVYGTNSPLLSRINFGNSLYTNSSSTMPLTIDIVMSGAGATNGGFDMIYDGNNWVAILTLNNSFTLVRLPSLNSTPTSSDIITGISNPYNSSMGDVVLKMSRGIYYGYTVSYDKGLQAINFGSSIFNGNPSISNITSVLPAGFTPYGIDEGTDNGFHYLFISTIEGDILKVSQGDDLSLAPISAVSLGKLGVMNRNIKFRLIKHQSRWIGFSPDYNSTHLYSVDFPENCGTIPSFSEDESPLVTYSQSGQKFIGLRAYTSKIFFSEKNKSVLITIDSAPDISFTSENICAQHDVFFTHKNESGNIQVFNWNFGDLSSISLDANPIHQFNSPGNYKVTLSATADNGCINSVTNELNIYSRPIASFTIPTEIICTNNEFTFVNGLVDNFDGNLSYEWSVDNLIVSTKRNLSYTFLSGGGKIIHLKAAIPGCESEVSQSISNVGIGPVVLFSVSGICQSTPTQFTNQTVESVQSWSWDFGDGAKSFLENPQHLFTSNGNYPVKLTVTNSSGCSNVSSKQIIIYSKPSPDFVLDLPPFSCNGTPSQFNNLTQNPTDSNISSWVWNFGDTANEISTDKNPLYTYANAGSYDVSLKATSNVGCSASVVKSVIIAPSPVIDITNTAACIQQGTRFDTSTPNAQSWLWTIGQSTYSFKNPIHVFSTSGDNNVKLDVTALNGCVGTQTKKITVPVPPQLSFSVSNACEDQPISFNETTSLISDIISLSSWSVTNLGNKTGSSVQYLFAEPGVYAVKLSSSYQSGCVYSTTKNITVQPSPIAEFIPSPEWGTPPLKVQFLNQSVGANSYSWKFNDRSNATSNLPSPTFEFTELGEYVVDLAATNVQGCSSLYSSKISVIVPNLDLELKKLELIFDEASKSYRLLITVKNNSNFSLNNLDAIVDISGNSLIKETFNTKLLPDGEITQLLKSQLLAHGNKLTYVCVRLDGDGDQNVANNALCEPIEQKPVLFYPQPNPSDGDFYFNWISPDSERVHFVIANGIGQIVLDQTFDVIQPGLNQMVFRLKGVTTGTYYFRFSSNGVTKSFPVLINNK